MIALHTPRLLLRECLPDDAAALRAFDTNPAIWQFRGGALPGAEAELSGALDPAHWGHGLATEAGQVLLAWAFADLGLHRVWATCNPDNVGSWRVMEKLGMRREGHLRSVERVGEAWRDQYLYAILAEEWPATTAAKL